MTNQPEFVSEKRKIENGDSSHLSKSTFPTKLEGLETRLQEHAAFIGSALSSMPREMANDTKKRLVDADEEMRQPKRAKLEENGTTKNETPGLLTSLLLTSKNDENRMESLRSKLHARIEELRATRKADEQIKKPRTKVSTKSKQKSDKKKVTSGKEEASDSDSDSDSSDSESGEILEAVSKKVQKVKKLEEDIQFSTFTSPKEKSSHDSQGKSKEKLLREALVKKRKISENPELEQEFAYENSIKRAKGEKIKDDPKLLAKSLKKKKKQKEVSKASWKDRSQQLDDKLKEKQRKRKENIQDHIRKKKEGKMGKKTKRPGFEGKK